MFLVDAKVFRFVVKGVKTIFLGVQGGEREREVFFQQCEIIVQ